MSERPSSVAPLGAKQLREKKEVKKTPGLQATNTEVIRKDKHSLQREDDHVRGGETCVSGSQGNVVVGNSVSVSTGRFCVSKRPSQGVSVVFCVVVYKFVTGHQLQYWTETICSTQHTPRATHS